MPRSDELDNRRKALNLALSVLNDRERRIFEARRIVDDPITLTELAEEFGISRERVRQIDVSSLEKVQKAVRSRVAATNTPSASADALTFYSLPSVQEAIDRRIALGPFVLEPPPVAMYFPFCQSSQSLDCCRSKMPFGSH